jgi:hypothetical protein
MLPIIPGIPGFTEVAPLVGVHVRLNNPNTGQLCAKAIHDISWKSEEHLRRIVQGYLFFPAHEIQKVLPIIIIALV